jgi:hypothetical protein
MSFETDHVWLITLGPVQALSIVPCSSSSALCQMEAVSIVQFCSVASALAGGCAGMFANKRFPCINI